jgi:hypothetical protein
MFNDCNDMFVSLKDNNKARNEDECRKVSIKVPATYEKFEVPYKASLLSYCASISLWQASFTEERLFTKIVTI